MEMKLGWVWVYDIMYMVDDLFYIFVFVKG